ncbi:MAG: hypothetical protein ACKVT2_20760 [Saprospiraceae bacterium]
MKETLLHKMLRNLTVKEFSEFVAFADSPFFNRDKRVVSLLERLQKAHPEFKESPAIAMNTLVKELKLGSEGNLRQLYSRTFKLLPGFFAQKELDQQPNTTRLLLLDALLNRSLENEFRSELQDFEQKISLDDQPFHARLRLYDFRLQEQNRGWSKGFVLPAYLDSSTAYFLLKKLKQASMLLLLQRVYKQIVETNLLHEMEFLLPFHEKLVKKDVVLFAWKQMYDLLNSADPGEDGTGLWQFVEKNKANIPPKEQKDLFNTRSNYLVGNLNRGHYSTLAELNWFYDNLTELYRFAVTNNLLHEGMYITRERFKNVLSAACSAGQSGWARDFLAENLVKVMPNHREDLWSFCAGMIAFYEHDFQKAAVLLSIVSTHSNEFYFFDVASLLMRIYLKEKNMDLFDSRAEAVRKKLPKTGFSDNNRRNYSNYFRLLKEMFDLKNHPATNVKAWNTFQEKVKNTNPVNQKKWLLENIP